MEKYITTYKHPLGAGHTIQESRNKTLDYMFNLKKSCYTMYLTKGHFKHLLSSGEIKELQKPEFTKDAMIEFTNWFLDSYSHPTKASIDILNNWKSKP